MYEELDDKSMKGTLRDWRKALRTPATYRVGNTVRVQPYFIYLIVLSAGFVLLLFYYNWWTNQVQTVRWSTHLRPYNSTYPLTPPFVSGDLITYRIGIISDLDTNSKSDMPYTFISYFKKGFLSYNKEKEYVTVTWDSEKVVLSSTYSHKGKGMELSELMVYDGRLLTFDDRSGMVFEIVNNKVIPWLIVPDGNGRVEKGFKVEWATEKDEMLYIGSMGKEWTTSSGTFQSYDPMWVKVISRHGEIHHQSWVNQYKAIRSSIGISWPGYMIHESGVWSTYHQSWYFLPRRCSYESYNETKDELMGCSYLITADEEFKNVKAVENPYETIHGYLPRLLPICPDDSHHSNVCKPAESCGDKKITKRNPKLGFSSFKFIPGTNDNAIVALKTLEHEGKTATYITAFTIDGKVLLKDTPVEDLKYEGVEFI